MVHFNVMKKPALGRLLFIDGTFDNFGQHLIGIPLTPEALGDGIAQGDAGVTGIIKDRQIADEPVVHPTDGVVLLRLFGGKDAGAVCLDEAVQGISGGVLPVLIAGAVGVVAAVKKFVQILCRQIAYKKAFCFKNVDIDICSFDLE